MGHHLSANQRALGQERPACQSCTGQHAHSPTLLPTFNFPNARKKFVSRLDELQRKPTTAKWRRFRTPRPPRSPVVPSRPLVCAFDSTLLRIPFCGLCAATTEISLDFWRTRACQRKSPATEHELASAYVDCDHELTFGNSGTPS